MDVKRLFQEDFNMSCLLGGLEDVQTITCCLANEIKIRGIEKIENEVGFG